MTHEIPPIFRNADGELMINPDSQRVKGVTIDLEDIRPTGDKIAAVSASADEVARFNDRRCVMFISRNPLSPVEVSAFNKTWAPLEVRSVRYGQGMQGLRANVIVVLDPPHTNVDSEWLYKQARLRLSKDGLWIEAF